MPKRKPVLVRGPRFMELAKQISGPMIIEIRERCYAMIEGMSGLDPRGAGGFSSSRLSFVHFGFTFVLFRSAPREWVVEVESEPTSPPRRRRLRPNGGASERVAAQTTRTRRLPVARLKRMLSNLWEGLWITGRGQITNVFDRKVMAMRSRLAILFVQERLARCFASVRRSVAQHKASLHVLYRHGAALSEFVYVPAATLTARECGAKLGMSLILNSYEPLSHCFDTRPWDASWFGELAEESELVA